MWTFNGTPYRLNRTPIRQMRVRVILVQQRTVHETQQAAAAARAPQKRTVVQRLVQIVGEAHAGSGSRPPVTVLHQRLHVQRDAKVYAAERHQRLQQRADVLRIVDDVTVDQRAVLHDGQPFDGHAQRVGQHRSTGGGGGVQHQCRSHCDAHDDGQHFAGRQHC